MSQKERQRYHLLKTVLEKKDYFVGCDGVRLMAISYRRAKPLKLKLVSEGTRGLVHGNRGRASSRA